MKSKVSKEETVRITRKDAGGGLCMHSIDSFVSTIAPKRAEPKDNLPNTKHYLPQVLGNRERDKQATLQVDLLSKASQEVRRSSLFVRAGVNVP